MTEQDKQRERVYQVSSNREKSSHKLRYVEASAPDVEDCRLCTGSLTAAEPQLGAFSITDALYDDISKIIFIERQAYAKEAYPAPFFYQALRQWPNTFLTLKINEKVAGYSLMVPVSGSCLSLMSLLVGKMFRGKGMGKALLQESVSRALKLGYRQLELSVSSENTAAVSLYHSFGFSIKQKVHDYLGPGQDRIIMRLTISGS